MFELQHGSPDVSSSLDLGPMEVKVLQIIYLTKMSPANTVTWNVKGKP
jgi:hypothetical protein